MDKTMQVEAVDRVQEYIRCNIKKRMTLHEISVIAGYSPWHISKLFKAYTGKTIFDYIRATRLSQAALYLRDNESVVLQVALDFMFDSHEGFTRAFSKQFGINPKKYATDTPPIKLFMPYPVKESINKRSVVMKNDKLNTVFVQVVDRPKRRAIIKRGKAAEDYFEYCEEVGCEVWGQLCSVKDAINEPMGMWLSDGLIKSGTSRYVQGVEVKKDFDGVIPDGFEIIELKACKMMIFQGPKYDDADFENEVLKVMEAVKSYDPKPFGFEWADDGLRFQFEPQGSRGYIEGKSVRLIV